MDILSQRLELLERTYIGGADVGGGDATDILKRIEVLSSKYAGILEEVPQFGACYASIVKLRPIILERKNSALQLSQRVEGLIATKDNMTMQMKALVSIGEMSNRINDDNLKGELSI